MTLVELMVSLVVGLLIVLAATSIFLGTRAAFRTQDDGAAIAETGAFASAALNRMVRQGGFAFMHLDPQTNLTPESRCRVRDGRILTGSPVVTDHGPRIEPGQTGKPEGIDVESDSITLRFCGAGQVSGSGDGGTLDCAGNTIAADAVYEAQLKIERLNTGTIPVLDALGQPQYGLVCYGRQLPGGTATRAVLAVGVETMRLAFGVDRNNTGFVGEWLAPGSTLPAAAQVRAVKVSYVVRGNNYSLTAPDQRELWHFGADDPNRVSYRLASLSASEQRRPRKHFASTITLRNQGDSL